MQTVKGRGINANVKLSGTQSDKILRRRAFPVREEVYGDADRKRKLCELDHLSL